PGRLRRAALAAQGLLRLHPGLDRLRLHAVRLRVARPGPQLPVTLDDRPRARPLPGLEPQLGRAPGRRAPLPPRRRPADAQAALDGELVATPPAAAAPGSPAPPGGPGGGSPGGQ